MRSVGRACDKSSPISPGVRNCFENKVIFFPRLSSAEKPIGILSARCDDNNNNNENDEEIYKNGENYDNNNDDDDNDDNEDNDDDVISLSHAPIFAHVRQKVTG